MFFNYIKLYFYFINLKKQNLSIREKNRWKKVFFYFLCNVRNKDSDYLDRWNIIKGFAKSDIKIIKKIKSEKPNEDPILICVVLNEMERIKVFMEHYRGIGIKKFAIVDNGSTDGTIDYLKMQRDVELFQTRDPFKSKIKVGWINRIISYYGTSHWYLVVDADELLVWQGVEQGRIQNILKYLDKKNITRARALMVDMYPKEVKWNTDASFKEVFPECRFFDRDTYCYQETKELYLICGGPRERKLGVNAWLTKYPLFKLKENEFMCNPHVIFPYDSKKIPCYFAILHYKFLTRSDREKVRKNAKEENYASNSAEYKLYLRRQRESIDNFNFYYDKSVFYQSSKSLKSIQQIDVIPSINKITENNSSEKMQKNNIFF